jgi:hypothetical protein
MSPPTPTPTVRKIKFPNAPLVMASAYNAPRVYAVPCNDGWFLYHTAVAKLGDAQDGLSNRPRCMAHLRASRGWTQSTVDDTIRILEGEVI